MLITAVIVVTLFGLLPLSLALSKYKNSRRVNLNLIGAVAVVEERIAPEGSVLISGELWRAFSQNERVIEPQAKVRVVSAYHHLLLVEPAD